ncbi:unnamed protein product [Closterium sp. Naga37s-1]|nr:unnamed protein product [Closterium sp. Naga37s-1]
MFALQEQLQQVLESMQPASTQTRSLLLDAAIHAEFKRLKAESKTLKWQDDLAVMQFTFRPPYPYPPISTHTNPYSLMCTHLNPFGQRSKSEALERRVRGLQDDLAAVQFSFLPPHPYPPMHIHSNPFRPRTESEALERRVRELQDDLAAVQFTPHSKNGKMLMAKCRTLQEENEDIGREAAEGKMLMAKCRILHEHREAAEGNVHLGQVVSEAGEGLGQVHELENKLALQKQLNSELKRGYQELQEYVDEINEEAEKLVSAKVCFRARFPPIAVRPMCHGQSYRKLQEYVDEINEEAEKLEETVYKLQRQLQLRDAEVQELSRFKAGVLEAERSQQHFPPPHSQQQQQQPGQGMQRGGSLKRERERERDRDRRQGQPQGQGMQGSQEGSEAEDRDGQGFVREGRERHGFRREFSRQLSGRQHRGHEEEDEERGSYGEEHHRRMHHHFGGRERQREGSIGGGGESGAYGGERSRDGRRREGKRSWRDRSMEREIEGEGRGRRAPSLSP